MFLKLELLKPVTVCTIGQFYNLPHSNTDNPKTLKAGLIVLKGLHQYITRITNPCKITVTLIYFRNILLLALLCNEYS